MRNISISIIAFIAAVCLVSCYRSDTLVFQGYVDGSYAYIASQVTGQLETLAVHRGEHVNKGDLLYQLDPQPTNFEVEEAKAQLNKSTETLLDLEKGERLPNLLAIKAQQEQVKAQLTNAKLTVSRYQALIKKGYIDRSAYDTAANNVIDLQNKLQELIERYNEATLAARSNQVKAAEQQVNISKANLDAAQWRLNQKIIHSPITGFVFDTHHVIGDVIPANQTVVSLLSNDDIKVIFFVPEVNLKNIQLQQTIHIADLDSHYFMNGKISYISPSAEYSPPVIYSRERMDKLMYRIEAKTDDVSHLHPGQPVTITIARKPS